MYVKWYQECEQKMNYICFVIVYSHFAQEPREYISISNQ